METIVYECERTSNRIIEKKEREKNIHSDFLYHCTPPTEPDIPIPPQKDIQNIIFRCAVALVCAIVGIAICVLFEGGFLGWAWLLICMCGSFWSIKCLCEEFKVYKDDLNKYIIIRGTFESRKKDYELECSTHEKAIKNAEIRFEKICNNLEKHADNISKEKFEINSKLQKAYSLNIIPLQFRNIQGIYYLYDYISTSNQSLSEALMQCNLEAIKQKLDSVIELQGKAIIQQAQANATIMEQNQRILETAQATMQNTAVAAKYAQICAVNSELSLKLQSKDLAYQKADFWLK